MILFSILVFLFSTLFDSCTRCDVVEGKVCEVTENTLTITTQCDNKLTFSIRDARMYSPAGIHRGSPVTVTYVDDIVDGFGNARTVNVPESYNLLIGRWVAPCSDNPDVMHGFELLENGDVIEIGSHSIIYNCWRFDGSRLSMAESAENLDVDHFDFAHHWKIEHLDHSMLTISYGGMIETFARVSR